MGNDIPEPQESSRKDGIITRLRSLFTSKENSEVAETAAETEESAGDSEDAFTNARRAMIERVVAFDEKRVFDVMAPRADIFAVDIETPLDELVRTFAEAGHSRMPIYRVDLDDPVGMVHIKDVVALLSGAKTPDADAHVLKTIRRDLLYAPPSMRVTDMLLRMQASRIHMALVIDEYGGTDGLVTIEDLVEEIVGEINDEHDDDDEPSVTPAPDGGWIADARAELDVFEEETGAQLNLDDDDEVDTVGGYVVSIAGRVPQRGEIITSPSGFDIEIAEADARKVRRLRIRPSRRPQSEAAE